MVHFIQAIIWGVIIAICAFNQDRLPLWFQVFCILFGLSAIGSVIVDLKWWRPKKKPGDTQ